MTKTTFPVIQNNDYIPFPFAGGMDAPQFSQADLNLDGLQDVFVFDRQGNTAIPFVTKFNEGVFSYEIDWDVLVDLPPSQNWALMKDFNGDGISDLFASAEQPGVPGIDVYRGRDAGDHILFDKIEFLLPGEEYDMLHFILGGGYTPLYVSYIDVPSITDVDGDGDIDVLSFEPEGSYMYYYRNIAVEQGLGIDTFVMEWDDSCWGGFVENMFSAAVELSPSPGDCGVMLQPTGVVLRHSGSSCFAHDVDGDNDVDLFLGDLSSANIKLLWNGGTVQQAWMTGEDGHFPGDDFPVDIPDFVSPFMVDINHDQILDFVAASNNTGFSENYNCAWYYRNDGLNGQIDMHLEKTDLFVSDMLDFGTASKPAFFDYNADGRMDIIVGSGGYYTPEGTHDARLFLLRNIGTATEPAFQLEDEDYLGFSQYASIPTWEFAPAAGDLDGDGDVDLLVGEVNGGLFFVENLGGPGQPADFALAPVYPYFNINVGSVSKPALIDLNRDGLMDIVCGERTGNNDINGKCSNLNYFQNTGTIANPNFNGNPAQSPNSQCLGGVVFNSIPQLSEYSAPEFMETKEGLRMLIGSEQGPVHIYTDVAGNVTDTFRLLNMNYGNIRDGNRTVPATADLNDDGFFEVVLGNKRGGLTMYHTNLRTILSATEETPKVTFEAEIIPNPFYGGGKVRLNAYGRNVRMEIASIDGKRIQQMSVSDGMQVQLSLPPGIYLVRFMSKDQLVTQKLIIPGHE